MLGYGKQPPNTTSLSCDFYLQSPLSWAGLIKALTFCNEQCQTLLGTSFKRVSYGNTMEAHRGVSGRDLPLVDFLQQPPLQEQQRYLYASGSCSLANSSDWVAYLSLNHCPPMPQTVAAGFPQTVLRISLDWTVPIPIFSHHLYQLMTYFTRLAHAEGITLFYACTDIGFIGSGNMGMQGLQSAKTHVPDDKLVGIRWGNLLTRQHLGKDPAGVLAAINETIAPKEVEEVVPNTYYYFQLPLELETYSKATDPQYRALVQKTLAACRPYRILYRNGIRRAYM